MLSLGMLTLDEYALVLITLTLTHRFNLVNHPFHGTDPAKYGVDTNQQKDQDN
jgi:hypothetical protein